MKYLSALVAVLFPVLVNAQISIGPDDMPSAGDTVRRQTTTLTSFDGSDTGGDHIWDFSSLVPQAEAADTCVTVGSTPLLYQFFFNNGLLYPNYHADYAVRGAAFDFQGVQVEDLYDYYKKSSDGFRNVGFGATINGLPASVQRQPIDRVYTFPLEYTDTDDGSSAFNIDVPTLGSFGQQQTRHNEVDGWGTLYLPADTFAVLRVKSVLNRRDTVFIDQFGIGFGIDEPETIEYKWLAAGMDEPVLQVTTLADVPTLVSFYYHPEDISTGLSAPASADVLAVMPNPATDQVRVRGFSGSGNLLLIDAQGRTVRRFAASSARERMIDVSALEEGVYQLRASRGTSCTRLVVAR